MPKTVVVLPTYNEAPNLARMVAALLDLGIPELHILVVDDESPDGTGQIAEDLSAQHPDCIRVIHNASKGGLGPAYITGFKAALADGAERVVQMDCDFSHQPKYLPQLLAQLDAGADLALGSRYVKGGGVDVHWSPFRKLLSWFANRVYVSVLLGLPVKDATGGYRAWTAEALRGLGLDRIHASGYVFQVEMAYVAHRLGCHIVESAIYFPDREAGESKMGSHIILEAALRVWEIRRRHRGLSAHATRPAHERSRQDE